MPDSNKDVTGCWHQYRHFRMVNADLRKAYKADYQ